MKMTRTGIFLRLFATVLACGVMSASILASQTSKRTRGSQASTAANPGTSDTKIDLNTASEKDLDTLPGVGTVTAKKIIAGRPYSSVGDLSKAGIPAGTIEKITPLVTTGGGGSAMSTKT